MQPPVIAIDLDAPLYDEDDAKLVMPLFQRARYGADHRRRARHPARRSIDAGHILGSAIIDLEIRETRRRRAHHDRLLGRPRPPGHADPARPDPDDRADYVVVESTYGGREHEPGEEADPAARRGRSRVDRDAGGVLLIPSFAIGRTQEIVWELDRLIERRRDPAAAALPRLADGVARLRRLPPPPRVLRRGDREAPARGRHAARLPGPDTSPATVDDSKAIATADRPYMIVSSNGMLTGGRVGRPPAQPHRRPGRNDPVRRLPGRGHARAAPPGRREDGQARRPDPRGPLPHPLDLRLLRPRRRVRAARLARATSARPSGRARLPRKVFLVHGDPDAQHALRPEGRGAGLRRPRPASGARSSRSTEPPRRPGVAAHWRDAPQLQVLEPPLISVHRRRGQAPPRRGRHGDPRQGAPRAPARARAADRRRRSRPVLSRRTSSTQAIASAPSVVQALRPRRQPSTPTSVATGSTSCPARAA